VKYSLALSNTNCFLKKKKNKIENAIKINDKNKGNHPTTKTKLTEGVPKRRRDGDEVSLMESALISKQC
jgi:hypothetical protein